MKNDQRSLYEETEELRRIIKNLRNRKFQLDCGHHVTFGYELGNDVTIRNGKYFKITCLECCY